MKWLVLTAFFLCGSKDAHSQSYTIRKLTLDDGLSQASNYFRLEDSKGFVWLSANNAVNRYDGNRVKVYDLDRYFINCPPLQQAYNFVEGEEQNVYIGSVRGLYRYERKLDRFSLIPIYDKTGEKEAIPIGYFQGKMWCIDKSYLLTSYNVNTKEIRKYGHLGPNPIPSIHVYDLIGSGFYSRLPVLDLFGKIWTVDVDCIWRFDLNSNKLAKYPSPYGSNFQQAYWESKSGRFYVFNSTNVFQFNTRLPRFNKLKISLPRPYYISGLAVQNDDIAISLTDFEKIMYGKVRSDSFIEFMELKSDITDVKTTLLGFDKDGKLWHAQDGLGQYIFDFRGYRMKKYPEEYSDRNSDKQKGVGSISEFANGNIYIDEYKAIFKNQKLFIKSDKRFNLRNTLNSYTRQLMGYSTDIRHSFNGIGIYNEDGSFSPKCSIDRKDIGLIQHVYPINASYTLCATSAGLLWLKDFKPIKIPDQPYKSAFYLNPISKNRILVSYLIHDMQLVHYDQNGKIEFAKSILPGVQSYYAKQDSISGNIWIGTNQGVYLLNEDLKILKHFDANTRLAGNNIYGLLLDNTGNCWVSHQRGLSSIDRQNYNVINYDKSDGIQDWDFNNRAFLKASDGFMYFGGNRGFNYFKPPLTQSSNYSPLVFIDEIFINNQFYNTSINPEFLEKLNLKHDENNVKLTISVRDLGFSGAQACYRFIGKDTLWTLIKKGEDLVFSQMKGGDFKIELGIYDKYLNQYKSQKTISIHIGTVFFKAIWFWVIVTIIIGGMLLQYYNRLKIKKNQELLDKQIADENQRKKITADLHDDIGAALSSLQINSTIALKHLDGDVNKAKPLVQKIEHQSQVMTETMNDFIWSLRPHSEQFMSLSTRIKNYANDILGAREIEFKLNYDKEVDTLIQEPTQKKNLIMIIREVINNAAKYSQATNLNLDLHINNNRVFLEILDNGKGFKVEDAAHGGLNHMKMRMHELGGDMHLNSEIGQGTSFKFSFPLTP